MPNEKLDDDPDDLPMSQRLDDEDDLEDDEETIGVAHGVIDTDAFKGDEADDDDDDGETIPQDHDPSE